MGLLLALPILFALLVYISKSRKSTAVITRVGAGAIIAAAVAFCAFSFYFPKAEAVNLGELPFLKYNIFVIEIGIALYLLYKAYTEKSFVLGALSVGQMGFAVYTEFFAHTEVESETTLYVDSLTLMFVLIVGVIGGLICIYSVEYMKDFHRHEPHVKNRTGFFIATMFVFLSAMFGIVFSNDLSLMLMFWEVTSLCSYLLIGYNQTASARKNALLAIKINAFGGILFAVGVYILKLNNIADLTTLAASNATFAVQLAVLLIAVGALTKCAQFPFSSWLLGAMVAPSPSSALLHSSTMVKAGIFLLLRISPLLGSNTVGTAVTTIGGVTFIISALMAVSQTDSKRVLAHSTVSNLGLIVACVGINTSEAIWAAVMLTLFHAIAKSLLFLAVGSATHQLGSRDIEEMDGLIGISKTLTVFFIIGIAGMFLAPFGMLISKWAAMKAFLDSHNILIVFTVAFGSTVTLFFWTKWLGKLIANAHRKPSDFSYKMRGDEKVSMFSLAALVVGVCMLHPFVSDFFVIPYIGQRYAIVQGALPYAEGGVQPVFSAPIDPVASWIMVSMIGAIFILPLILIPLYRHFKVKQTSVYLSGENTGDDESFYGSLGQTRKVELKNWYMQSVFGEKFWMKKTIYIGAGILIAGFFAVVGGQML
jgi:ech hydrogenase subunit A